jgi:hypothetical protein
VAVIRGLDEPFFLVHSSRKEKWFLVSSSVSQAYEQWLAV